MTPMRAIRGFLLALVLALVLVLAAAVWPPGQALAQDPPVETAVDYSVWASTADTIEAELERRDLSDQRLEEMRAQVADWRAALLTAQSANSARIGTVKEQIAALGPVPAEGETEAEEISSRRKELADRLVKLQSPGLAADEAYRRADGLIREIDRVLRERQADELMQLWPSPVNPANWPEAAVGISDTLLRFWDELADNWENRALRAEFFKNLPLILVLVLLWAGLTIYARRWIEKLADRLQGNGSQARRHVLDR